MTPSISHDPMTAFRKDLGAWDGEITITPAPGQEAQHSKGRLTGRLVCGGKWLVLEFKNHTTGFEGYGIYGYDASAKKYVGTWIDDMRGSLIVAEGAWDEPSRTMTFHWRMPLPDGRTIEWRDISKAVSDDEQSFRIVMAGPDGRDFEMLNARYIRAKS